MKTIYLDSDYKCHVAYDGTMVAVETDVFDGKCATYIEGYRYIPAGHSWTNSKGVTFVGEMMAPITNHVILEAAQSLYNEMSASAVKEDRIKALEEENAMLMECLLEMSEIVYA